MEIATIEAKIEAILFAMGDAVEVSEIANTIGHNKDVTRKIIVNMMDKYNEATRGIQIVELNDSFQLSSKPEYYDDITKIVHMPKETILTDVLLETLSIIAYKQPITKVQIENIRGVKSDHGVNKLIEYNLVNEVGRMDAPGKPILFGTSKEFLRHFGLTSVDELPAIDSEKMEDFKLEVEEEMQLKLDI